ncbi:transposase [Streptomyces sp. NPDC001933]|uniref:transposase n=1 Tax=Streptomyces sp. NPDC001933 TaxID=3364626 RepID=UPI0036A21AC6
MVDHRRPPRPGLTQRQRLRPFLPTNNGRCGRRRDHRQVIDGILHRVRTGAQWRDLSERFGPWKRCGYATNNRRRPRNVAYSAKFASASSAVRHQFRWSSTRLAMSASSASARERSSC